MGLGGGLLSFFVYESNINGRFNNDGICVFVRFLVDYPAYIHQMTAAYDKNVLM